MWCTPGGESTDRREEREQIRVDPWLYAQLTHRSDAFVFLFLLPSAAYEYEYQVSSFILLVFCCPSLKADLGLVRSRVAYRHARFDVILVRRHGAAIGVYSPCLALFLLSTRVYVGTKTSLFYFLTWASACDLELRCVLSCVFPHCFALGHCVAEAQRQNNHVDGH